MQHCTIDDCEKPVRSLNLCVTHYARKQRWGEPILKEEPSPEHGMRKTSEYYTWASMKTRCQNPKYKSYDYYGGRGIKVCERWQKFPNFLEDMGRKPAPEYTLDRIDSNGDYEPNNCHWVKIHHQAVNKRTSSKHVSVIEIKNKSGSLWKATLSVKRVRVLDGTYDTFDEALRMRKEAEQKWNVY